jgi:hydrogenase maturation factor
MHDPTEGGLATALHEMANAAALGISVDGSEIDVLPETRILCDKAGLDPLGLLASGALLLAVAPGDAEPALQAVRAAGATAGRIGAFVPPAQGVIMKVNNQPRALPRFPRDEVARFLTRETPQTKEQSG